MKFLVSCLLLVFCSLQTFAQTTTVQYLSGRDKDHTIPWDFRCSEGRKSGVWTKIPVPSNWELQGFGAYNYGHDKNKSNEQGEYRYEFSAGKWDGKKVFLVFEGAMTDTQVKINGRVAGPVHQGGFTRFKYDVSGLIHSNARNLLEVTVAKNSADPSVNRAERNGDFWVFGGIYRPVTLEIVPQTFIDRVAVNARADGSFTLDVYAPSTGEGQTVEAQVETSSGQAVGRPFSVKVDATSEKVTLNARFGNVALWSAEFPNLYQVVVSLKDQNGGTVHRVTQRFGFRTVELRRGDGLYVNGARVHLKGSNRHSFWPDSGRTLSHEIQVQDVRLMKEMNMNAVRMSHYPPDQDFLDVCDSLGLYVLDELTGWQAHYDSPVGHKLVKELVVRDVNHPSILFWDNGNEGGWNTELDNDYALYDPQNRVVLHPWSNFNGADTHHYPDYKAIGDEVANGKDVFFPTEFMHGLYDGGAGAGLDDFWDLMMQDPHGAGGFIWGFLDESVIRTDKNGAYDGDGNHAPDGIVGPHREREASFYAIKEIWSPVYINPVPIDARFDGRIAVENRYSFTNLSQCAFKWSLVKFPLPSDKSLKPKIVGTGIPVVPSLAPGQKGTLDLRLPPSWNQNDALYLTAFGPDKAELFTWSWKIPNPTKALIAARRPKAKVQSVETTTSLTVNCDGVQYVFDKTTGFIQKVVKPKATVSLSGGPVLAGVTTQLKGFSAREENGQFVVAAQYEGEGFLQTKWTFAPGQPVKLEYQTTQTGDFDFMGISFNYPEDKIIGMKWLGRGPYRVWKNRLKGQQLGVWHKDYNNAITGETWSYPEFKGYHADVNWVVIENRESPFTVYCDNPDMFLQMLHPAREQAALSNNNVEPAFPTGDISFLSAISPIGTKFQAASKMGPQSQTNHADGQPLSGTLWFDFGH